MDTNTLSHSRAAIRAVLDSGGVIFPASILTVGERVQTGEREHAPDAPTLSAPADEAVADDPHGPDVQQVVVAADTYRQDGGSMEHTRQSRLQRWQEQRP